MCHRGKSLRLAEAAAASTKGCNNDIPVMLKKKKTGSSCGSQVDGIDIIRPSFQLRLAPPHCTDDTSNSSCASTSTLTSISSDTSVGSTRRQCCNNNNNRKKVSFKDTVHIRHIPSLRYYTRVQLAEMYHTPMELMAIHQEFARQLRIIQFEEDIPDGEDDDSDICSRGLEQETKEGRRERRIHRKAALCSVLNEQARQKKYGIVNPTLIARLYSATTKDSVYAATEKGTWDAFDAQQYLSSQAARF